MQFEVGAALVKPVRDVSSQAVAARLRDLIVFGNLEPGARISERPLQEQLGITRTPLREALKILEVEGLVALEPNRGARVVRLTLAEIEGALDLICAIEGLAAELACLHASDVEIENVARLHEEMRQAHEQGDREKYFHLNQGIHLAIVDSAGNASISRVYRSESIRIHRARYAGNLNEDRWDRAVFEHEQMLDAFRNRSGPLLREMITVHHRNGWKVTRPMIEAELTPGVPSKRGI